jgi:hypothetical protein
MTEIVLALKRARLPRAMTAIRPKSFGHQSARAWQMLWGQNISATAVIE